MKYFSIDLETKNFSIFINKYKIWQKELQNQILIIL